VHHIERAEELDAAWFHGSEVVGITAGTSTLKETVAAVHARLEQLARDFSKQLATHAA
jgi:4-hydroxy-3-methylbut-2-en-1-yl diphosphate reductase